MIIGIMSDAHGNIYGLKDCVALLETHHADDIYFIGDAVNYFGRSAEVLDFLKQKKIKCVKGNHEDMLLKDTPIAPHKYEIYNVACTKERLQKEHYEYISSWGDFFDLKLEGLRIFLGHGSPFNHFIDYIYADSDLERLSQLPYDMMFSGHTHVPFVKHMPSQCIVNVGSVGFCRDDGSRLSCALLNVKTKEVRILESPFPQDKLKDLEPFHPEVYKILNRRKKSNP